MQVPGEADLDEIEKMQEEAMAGVSIFANIFVVIIVILVIIVFVLIIIIVVVVIFLPRHHHLHNDH